MTLASEVHADPIVIREVGDHLTEATVTVDATPAELYAIVTDYAHWPTILSDVPSVKIERGPSDHARVRFHSKVFDHDVTVQFDNEQDHRIRFKGIKGPPGGRASGEYILEPAEHGRTYVIATLHLDVVGIPSLFVSGARLRHMREAKLRSDMTDVIRALDARHAPAHAAR